MNTNKYKQSAKELKLSPKESSWDRLEIMLDNNELKKENKNHKFNLRFLMGIAASFLVLFGIFYISDQNAGEVLEGYQVSYSLFEDNGTDAEMSERSIYDLNKISELNGRYF